MADEMVERVAQALWDSEPVVYSWGPQERHSVTWERAVERNLAGVGIFRKFARAAIKATREPTADMIDAGRQVGTDVPYGVQETAERWRAMIDAALGCAPPEGE